MRTGRSCKTDNRGFSLVELLITIAIMVVVIGGVTAWTGVIAARSARQCAQQLQHTLAQARIDTMGKGSLKVEFYYDAARGYFVKETINEIPSLSVQEAGAGSHTKAAVNSGEGEEKKIGNKRCTVVVIEKDNVGAEISRADLSSMEFEFNRATGAFTKPTDVGKKEILITGGRREFRLRFDQWTGEVELVS